MGLRLLAASLLLAGCTDFFLEEPPREETPSAPQPPEIASFGPASGYAGTPLVIRGARFGDSAALVDVGFGAVSARPSRVSASGDELEVAVPEGARTGPVTVTTSAGGAVSPSSFTYLGAGHLLRRRVVLERSLAPQVESAVPVDTRELALVHGGLVVVAGPGQPPVTGLSPQRDVFAIAEANGKVAVVAGEPAGCKDRATCAGLVLRLFSDLALSDVLSTPSPLAEVRWSPSSTAHRATVALDRTAKFAAVASDGGAALVDLTAKKATTLSDEVTSVVSSGPGAFVGSAGDTGLVLFDAGAGTSRSSYPDIGTVGGLGALAAGPIPATGSAPVYADGYPAGLVALDVDAEVGTDLFGPPLGVAASLAASTDGARLAASLPDVGAVALYGREGSGWTALASAPLESPGEVFAAADGLFHVARRGGITLLAQQTGAAVAALPLSAGLASPTFGTGCDGAPVLDLAQAGLGGLVRLNPARLESACAPPVPPAAEARPLVRLAATRGSDVRFGLAAAGLAAPTLYRLAPGAAPASFDVPSAGSFQPDWRLAAASDGSAVVLTYSTATPVARALVLDPNKPFPPASPAALGVEDRATIVAGAAGAGTVAVVTGALVHLFDLAAALEGRAVERASTAAGADALVAASEANGLLYVVGRKAGGCQLAVVRLADGQVTAPAPLPSSACGGLDAPDARRLTAFVSPGGRRLYWFEGAREAPQLAAVAVDPESGKVGAEELPVPLPAGVSDVAFAPDGERAVVVDGLRDRVLLLE